MKTVTSQTERSRDSAPVFFGRSSRMDYGFWLTLLTFAAIAVGALFVTVGETESVPVFLDEMSLTGSHGATRWAIGEIPVQEGEWVAEGEVLVRLLNRAGADREIVDVLAPRVGRVESKEPDRSERTRPQSRETSIVFEVAGRAPDRLTEFLRVGSLVGVMLSCRPSERLRAEVTWQMAVAEHDHRVREPASRGYVLFGARLQPAPVTCPMRHPGGVAVIVTGSQPLLSRLFSAFRGSGGGPP